MELMSRYEDNYFDLAIVDPPYGIGASKGVGCTRGKESHYTVKEWDNERPKPEYFIEVQRISKNQIIFGGNYFADLLPASRCWIYWRKTMGGNYADGELAWTSFDAVVKEYTKRSDSGNRFHPTQKPVKLYEWLLMNYAKEGDKILDTHLGSGSIAIACHNLNYDLTACELDKEYFESAMKRINNHTAQLRII